MKTVVSLQDLVDFEIHPGALLEEFHALTRTSVAALVSGPLVDVPCPACAGTDSSAAFTKLGLNYRLCGTCASVFVSPRPKASALAEYAQSSPAAAFWRDRILGETRAARLDKLIRPRAEWVLDALAEHRPGARAGLDLSGQGPAFLKELGAQSPALGSLTSADPMRRRGRRRGSTSSPPSTCSIARPTCLRWSPPSATRSDRAGSFSLRPPASAASTSRSCGSDRRR